MRLQLYPPPDSDLSRMFIGIIICAGYVRFPSDYRKVSEAPGICLNFAQLNFPEGKSKHIKKLIQNLISLAGIINYAGHWHNGFFGSVSSRFPCDTLLAPVIGNNTQAY